MHLPFPVFVFHFLNTIDSVLSLSLAFISVHFPSGWYVFLTLQFVTSSTMFTVVHAWLLTNWLQWFNPQHSYNSYQVGLPCLQFCVHGCIQIGLGSILRTSIMLIKYLVYTLRAWLLPKWFWFNLVLFICKLYLVVIQFKCSYNCLLYLHYRIFYYSMFPDV